MHEERPRLAGDYSFPGYAYVPGHFPHPKRSPEGHSYDVHHDRVFPLVRNQWRSNRLYLHGIDLFNHGYYWESHEAWEDIWHKSGHNTDEGLYLKSLIKFSAAGVKIRERLPSGARTHARLAGEGFETLRERYPETDRYMGVSLTGLIAFAWRIENNTPQSRKPPAEREIVFDYVIEPL